MSWYAEILEPIAEVIAKTLSEIAVKLVKMKSENSQQYKKDLRVKERNRKGRNNQGLEKFPFSSRSWFILC